MVAQYTAREVCAMREIKFRAWNKKAKIMFQDVGFDQTSHSGDTIVYLQYTGLKDKNDKEIYEGDIIRFTSTSAKKRKAGKYNDMVVVWGANTATRKTGWYMVWRVAETNTYNRLENAVNDNHEVIGNIYENKELLND